MRCPFCFYEDTQVKDSRTQEDGKIIKRRRYCSKCTAKFNTVERLQLKELIVIKRSGAQKPFNREKIINSLKTATRKRQISTEEIEKLTDAIISDIENNFTKTVSTKQIGEKIMSKLAEIDEVAYIRFASVYLDFNSAKDFKKFVN